MTDGELAWAAGLFEGEGSVRISKPALRNWGSLCVDIPNTDLQIVEFFASRWVGSVKHYGESGRRREYWRWRSSSKNAAAFLADIRPYVQTDRVRERIGHALEFQAQKAQRSDYDYAEAQWTAYWWMAELNIRGVR